MRVAFLGLGIMGRSMAANLVKAGHEVAVWNRTAAAENGVEGARRAASPADAVQGAEVVWMCVSDTKAVESVLFGPEGAAHALAAGRDHCRLKHDFALRHVPLCRAIEGARH